MIKITNVDAAGWEHAIRGMRNPMNSWDKSDTVYGTYWGDIDEHKCWDNDGFMIGKNDLSLMKRLVKAGTDHRKFMRMIVVYCDITAPMYWWKEFDTYKVGTVRNSTSTMHKIHSNPFTVSDFSMSTLMQGNYESEKTNFLSAHYKHFTNVINSLNNLRDLYLSTQDKAYWRSMIEMLPSSYNQKSTVMLNYEVLANMYHSRKNHKLDEWREFCKWIESLPYSKELIIGE